MFFVAHLASHPQPQLTFDLVFVSYTTYISFFCCCLGSLASGVSWVFICPLHIPSQKSWPRVLTCLTHKKNKKMRPSHSAAHSTIVSQVLHLCICAILCYSCCLFPPSNPISHKVPLPIWSSRDPITNEWLVYSPILSAQIESAHSQKQPSASLTIGANDFTVVFSTMRQYNESGGSRPVARHLQVIVANLFLFVVLARPHTTTILFCPLSFVLCHLSVCHLPFALRLLSFALCSLSFVFCPLSLSICSLSSVHLSFTHTFQAFHSKHSKHSFQAFHSKHSKHSKHSIPSIPSIPFQAFQAFHSKHSIPSIPSIPRTHTHTHSAHHGVVWGGGVVSPKSVLNPKMHFKTSSQSYPMLPLIPQTHTY